MEGMRQTDRQTYWGRLKGSNETLKEPSLLPPSYSMHKPVCQSGLEAKHLASTSASKLWPRPRPRPRPRSQPFGLGLASISLSYYVIGHFSGKNRVKFGNFVNLSVNNLKSYVVIWYFFVLFLASALASISRNWPRPRSSGLGLDVWPRLSSLVCCCVNADGRWMVQLVQLEHMFGVLWQRHVIKKSLLSADIHQ